MIKTFKQFCAEYRVDKEGIFAKDYYNYYLEGCKDGFKEANDDDFECDCFYEECDEKFREEMNENIMG